jgi:cytochrome P450
MNDVDPAALADLTNWSAGPPHHLFDALRANGPVVWVPTEWGTQDSGGYWAVLSHEAVGVVGRNPDIYTSTRGASFPAFAEEVADGSNNMMLQDDPSHRRVRDMAGRSFSPRVVAQFDGWVRRITRDCLDRAFDSHRFDFVKDVASVIPAEVIAELMGVPSEDRHLVVDWSKGLFERDAPDGRERAGKAVVSLLRYAMALREQKRARPGVDVVSELVAAEAEGNGMSSAEFRHFIMVLLAAGFETTHTLIAQSALLLLGDSQIEEASRAAIRAGGVSALTGEFLRYVSPPMNMARFTTRDTELSGQRLLKGQMVVMWFVAANRDPLVFADPHRFDAARTPNNHVAFGPPGSPHYCLGQALGRLEGRILLEELLGRREWLALTGSPEHSGGVFINGLKALPVEVVR